MSTPTPDAPKPAEPETDSVLELHRQHMARAERSRDERRRHDTG